MPEPQQSKSIAKPEATPIVSEIDSYRQKRRQQLLAQCNDIIDLRADVDSRKLVHIINHAVASAFV